MFNKKNIAIVVVLVLIIAGFGFWQYKASHANDYSVVYLRTGEVYVGKLTTFPNLQLKDAYIFQVVKDEKDPNKSNFNLNPISEALWAPKQLYLNKDQVIFYGPLLSTSKIAQTLAGQKK
mgnify:CR=1 FL=1